MTEFEPTVKRWPIVVGEHCIALVTIFRKRSDHFEDCWSWDWLSEEVHTQHARSAKVLVESFEDQWSPAFFMSLRREITAALEDHDKKFGTSFALTTGQQ